MLEKKTVILRKILPLLLILALVPSLMTVPAAAADVDDIGDGVFNLLISSSYNFYRNGSLYMTGMEEPNVYCTAYVNSLALEWSPAGVNRSDAFYVSIYADRVPDNVIIKPFSTANMSTVYLGSNGFCHQFAVRNNPTNLGAITVICEWNERYRGNFGILSFTGIRKDSAEIISTIDYLAKEVYADDNLIMQYDTVSSASNSSVPFTVWHDSTKINDHSLDFRIASTLKPSQHGLKWLREIQLNVSSFGDSTFTASLISTSGNEPIADLPITVIDGERTTVLIDNGFEYPMMNYTVFVDVSGYDLSLYSLQINSTVGKYTSSWSNNGMVSYFYQVNGIVGIPEVYENPWYVVMFQWLKKSISNVGNQITDAVNGGALVEQNAANKQGQSSATQLENAVPDLSDGFVDSVTGLAASMSYDGTAAVLSSGPVVFPAIGNVVPSFTILDSVEVDFETYVNMMPAPVLLLVRSLFTIALIVYCFKELYSTIAYILTLKGGGD